VITAAVTYQQDLGHLAGLMSPPMLGRHCRSSLMNSAGACMAGRRCGCFHPAVSSSQTDSAPQTVLKQPVTHSLCPFNTDNNNYLSTSP